MLVGEPGRRPSVYELRLATAYLLLTADGYDVLMTSQSASIPTVQYGRGAGKNKNIQLSKCKHATLPVEYLQD
jgi:hypothetical protein